MIESPVSLMKIGNKLSSAVRVSFSVSSTVDDTVDHPMPLETLVETLVEALVETTIFRKTSSTLMCELCKTILGQSNWNNCVALCQKWASTARSVSGTYKCRYDRVNTCSCIHQLPDGSTPESSTPASCWLNGFEPISRRFPPAYQCAYWSSLLSSNKKAKL